MNIANLLSNYEPSELYIHRVGYVPGEDKVDYAVIRNMDTTYSIWYDRDVGLRIAQFDLSSRTTACVVETTKNRKVKYQIESVSGTKQAEFDLEEYKEEEYFQLSLIHDLSEFSYESYVKFYEIIKTVSKLIKENSKRE